MVILEALVGTDGCVESVKILRSRHLLLDKASEEPVALFASGAQRHPDPVRADGHLQLQGAEVARTRATSFQRTAAWATLAR